MKIIELRGLKSVRVYQLYQQVLIAYAILPTTHAASIKDFLTEFETKSPEEKRRILRRAAMFYDFQGDDVLTILDFATVKHTGVEYSQQIHAMTPDEIIKAIAEVLLKCSDIKCFFWEGIEPTVSPISQ
ncbi:MAG: hypothetical protein E7011_02050 [Alphaproteobacteria bacterium]|nr:hypothetical protein [Alphaproteobacteria bacterium]